MGIGFSWTETGNLTNGEIAVIIEEHNRKHSNGRGRQGMTPVMS